MLLIQQFVRRSSIPDISILVMVSAMQGMATTASCVIFAPCVKFTLSSHRLAFDGHTSACAKLVRLVTNFALLYCCSASDN